MSRSALAACALLLAAGAQLGLGCRPSDPEPESTADCQASRVCEEQGRCTMDYATRKCVVGSNADCAQSKACQKDRLCYKVGDFCSAANGE